MPENYDDLKEQSARRTKELEQEKEKRQKEIRKKLLIAAGICAVVLLVLLIGIHASGKGKPLSADNRSAETTMAQVKEETVLETAAVTEAPVVTEEATPEPVAETPAPEIIPKEEESAPETAAVQESSEEEPAAVEEPIESTDMPNSASNPQTVTLAGEWSGKGSRTRYTLENGDILTGSWQSINGQTYHFNQYGYADLGWKMVDGQRCYFDDSGIYVPDAVPGPMIAFTFDDGPSQGMDQLLGLCDELGARVTFFMIGAQVETGGAVIPFILDYRCELGNHSYSHKNKLSMTTEECTADFDKCDEYIMSFSGGIPSSVVRFPYGDYTPEEAAALSRPSIMWSIDTLDWKTKDEELIYNKVMSQVEEGDIILMHDRYDATVAACRRMFPELIAQGYQLVTVSELAASKGIELQPGTAYYSLSDSRIANGTIGS